MTDKNDIEKILNQKLPWTSLYGLANDKGSDTVDNNETTETIQNLSPEDLTLASGLTAKARALGSDVAINPESLFKERGLRLNLSVRDLEDAKAELLAKGLIQLVWVGKGLLLAPAPKLYLILGLPSPYKRNVSQIHSFKVLAAERLVKTIPLVRSTKREVPIGDGSGSYTLDLLVQLKNGQLWAYEIVHHTIGNVCSAAAKLQGKGFAQICFICSNHNQREAVRASIKNAGFDPDFVRTIRYTIFSSLIQQRKKMRLKELKR